MTEPNLQEIHDLLVSIALEAGTIQLSATPSLFSTSTKQNTADLVTETDKAIEHLVSTRLSTAHPSILFIGEETYFPGQKLTDAPTFICDPIDGTTNFVHGYPSFCISLGLAIKKKPVVGVIYNPSTAELFTAISGQGSFLSIHGGEKQRLPLRHPPQAFGDLSTCLVGIEWGSERQGNNYAVKCETFRKLAASKGEGGAMVHSLRSAGSAALHIAFTAAGRQDVYWEGGPWAWDVCAGWCILEEAGGRMVGGNPGVWDVEVEGRCYLAVRGGEGWRGVVEEVWGCVGEGRMVYEV